MWPKKPKCATATGPLSATYALCVYSGGQPPSPTSISNWSSHFPAPTSFLQHFPHCCTLVPTEEPPDPSISPLEGPALGAHLSGTSRLDPGWQSLEPTCTRPVCSHCTFNIHSTHLPSCSRTVTFKVHFMNGSQAVDISTLTPTPVPTSLLQHPASPLALLPIYIHALSHKTAPPICSHLRADSGPRTAAQTALVQSVLQYFGILDPEPTGNNPLAPAPGVPSSPPPKKNKHQIAIAPYASAQEL